MIEYISMIFKAKFGRGISPNDLDMGNAGLILFSAFCPLWDHNNRMDLGHRESRVEASLSRDGSGICLGAVGPLLCNW